MRAMPWNRQPHRSFEPNSRKALVISKENISFAEPSILQPANRFGYLTQTISAGLSWIADRAAIAGLAFWNSDTRDSRRQDSICGGDGGHCFRPRRLLY